VGTKPKVIDATLREGVQAPGVRFGSSESIEIASALCDLGVEMIECGHPLIGPGELERVQRVVGVCKNVPVLAHARARPEDVDAVKATGASWVGIFFRASGIAPSNHIDPRDHHVVISKAISHAKRAGLRIRFTAEDSSRTAPGDLVSAFRAALNAGADRLCFADTVGILNPWQAEEVIRELKAEFPDAEFEAHFHDDRGFAEANALAALRAGVTWISSSINGLGERCGVTDTITLFANLHAEGLREIPDGRFLQRASKLVRAHSRMQPDSRRPVMGQHAFTHTAKLHRQAAEQDPRAYIWMDPERLGRTQETLHTGLPLGTDYLINTPKIVSAAELPYHRQGPGHRYVMIDDRVVNDARQYCIARTIPAMSDGCEGHVDRHRHTVDSLFLFLGSGPDLSGLTVEVQIGEETLEITSPASVFIPSGVYHTYRLIRGGGIFINHVLSGSYHSSLLDIEDASPSEADTVCNFLRDRLTGPTPRPDMLVREVFDSLMLIDFFVYLESTLGDRISLDEVAACGTLAELTTLIADASRRHAESRK
jgi:2-isopropylmalate synthase